MKVEYVHSYRSCVGWEDEGETAFKSIDGLSPSYLHVNRDSPHWQMELCHELGHIYLSKSFSMRRYNEWNHYAMRIEMMAHRLAKSFCKPKYWSDKVAIEMLTDYANSLGIAVNVDKLKKNGIIPLNKGINLKE